MAEASLDQDKSEGELHESAQCLDSFNADSDIGLLAAQGVQKLMFHVLTHQP